MVSWLPVRIGLPSIRSIGFDDVIVRRFVQLTKMVWASG